MSTTTIFFDMDGTIADFYGVEGWLDYLMAFDTYPYETAKPLIPLNILARLLNRLQKEGKRIGIISYLSKSGTPEYNAKTIKVKLAWLQKHLPSVKFDEINIIEQTVPKESFCRTSNDILFDDEQRNRDKWLGKAFDVDNIIDILKGI